MTFPIHFLGIYLLDMIIATLMLLSCTQQKPVQKTVRPKTIKHVDLMEYLLNSGKEVCLVVLPDKYQDRRYLASRYLAGSILGTEEALLNILGKYDNFSLVDRTITNDILNELALQHSGAVTEKLRIKLGELYGITHMLMVLDSGVSGGVVIRRLIEIETGRILTIDMQY